MTSSTRFIEVSLPVPAISRFREIVVFLGSLLLPTLLTAQAPDQVSGPERPIPILTGNAGFFTSVNGGETGLVPSVTPVLLLPLGDRWLIESRAEFE